MSSTLKILVDIQCLVYCDYEEVGVASPGYLFKMELRKGSYILEFKTNDKTIVSKEYTIESDNQDYLLKINLSKQVLMIRREQESIKIANINAQIKNKDGSWWIIYKDTGCENRILYNVDDHTYTDRNDFDMVGLRSVNIGGEEVDIVACYVIKGGKWGCIDKQGQLQIPIIYDKSIYFYNDKVANAVLEGKEILINKFGEQLYDDKFDSLKGLFYQNQIVCKNGKNGVIDTDGTLIIPFMYECLERVRGNNKLFIIKVNNKYGIIDHNNHLLLPCIYDSIVTNKYNICVCIDNKWGVLDCFLRPIFPIEYEIYKANDPDNENRAVLVRKNGYFGILNRNISNPDNVTQIWNGVPYNIKEIVPCIYNAIYDESGREIESFTKTIAISRIFFVKKENEILHCYKYELQRNEKAGNSYNAICVKQFSCENFSKVHGEPYHNYILYKNHSIFTLMDDKIKLSLQFEPSKIIKLPQGNKYLFTTDNKIIVYENNEITECIENVEVCAFKGKVYGLKRDGKYAVFSPDFVQRTQFEYDELCEYDGTVYGLKKDGKYAVFSPDFVQRTQFEYDELCVSKGTLYGLKKDGKYAIYSSDFVQCTKFEYDGLRINDDTDCVEFVRKIHNRSIYGEYSYRIRAEISDGFLLTRDSRILYNWAEKYDQNKEKEGIISFNPPTIIVPFNYDYIRFYTGKKSTVFVVAKEFGNHPHRRFAFMNTKFELLTEYIFDDIHSDYLNKGYLFFSLFHKEDIYSRFDLDGSDIEIFAPFFYYEVIRDKYDRNNERTIYNERINPFKNTRLFIDTETTGLPINDNLPYTNLDNWPYLVQIAIIIEDDNYGILAKRNIVLKPDGYIIPESSTKVHGITNETAQKIGKERGKVIDYLDLALYNSDIIIGHNVSFDLNVIKSEIIRVKGMEKALFTKKKNIIVDTMEIGMNVCKIPNWSYDSTHSQPYKYPKLDELYYKLFNKHYYNQHNAMADVQATYECYYMLEMNQYNKNAQYE